MPANYPDWVSVTPKTHTDAVPTRTRKVVGVPAIRVTGATYRNCRPVDGVFELVSETPQRVAGGERFEVYCAWFGAKPLKKYPRISVRPGGYELLPSYTGSVIDNLSDGSPGTAVDIGGASAGKDKPVEAAELFEQFSADVRRSLRDSRRDRLRRLTRASKTPMRVRVLSYDFIRNPDVVAEVLLRAGGVCERCESDAPFARRTDGSPYLEVHHRISLADGGEDTLENAIALCPNCHRRLHYGPIEP